ncbi:MAG TPA: 50S ribosomal protein L25 [Vicinamibacterales bacterium]|jgi:large subunit ribosomal protein L25|nr:50S ribosomal protein L25 [Vicinamibacterales bacterium]
MEATLQAEKRDGRGKNEARRLRANGRIPAVVYGTEKNKATEISVDPKVLSRILHSESGVNTLIGLEGAGLATGGRVLVKEYQLDPIDHRLLHADFYAVAMDKKLTLTVPVVLKGEPKGVKQQGGIVDFVNREIEVEVLPADIPEHIDIDISELMLHQGIRVRDLPQDAKWKAISDAEMMIVHVVTVKAEAEPVAAEGAVAAATPATPAEPEVIKKGKKEEDEEKKK